MDFTNDISRRTVLKRGAIATTLLTLGGAATSGTVAAGIGDGRVLDFHLNNLNYDRDKGDIVAGHVHDASPSKNHGEWTPLETDPVVSGPVGNAFAFDGENTAITVPDNPSLDIQEELTIAFWFRLDGQSGNNAFPRAVSKGQSTTLNGAYGVFIEDGTLTNPNRIGLRFIDQNGDRNDIDPEITGYNDGAWHHVVATYSNAADVGKLYYDGVEQASVDVPGDVKIRVTDDDLTVGDGNGERHLNGALDEVRVYNRAISAAEVTDLYEMRDE